MKFKTSFFTACLVLYKSTAHPRFLFVNTVAL